MGLPPHEPAVGPPVAWTAYGPDALLFSLAERPGPAASARCAAICAWLEGHPPDGLIEFVPAFTTLLLRFSPGLRVRPETVAPRLAEIFDALDPAPESASPPVEIPVIYRGEDLPDVARHARLAVDDVIALHCAPVYRVAMLGFSPGFPYLVGLHPALHVPRRPSPRTHIAPGSVAIGGEHTGIYTVESPGGWNLIGSTTHALFDPGAPDIAGMFALAAGDRVKFVPVQP